MTPQNIPARVLDFAATCRVSLEKYELDTACQRITHALRKRLVDRAFLNDCFTTEDWEGRKIIYKDEQFGFCICAHINNDHKEAPPHNHGETWAIYGQAAGHTEMSEWEQTEHAGIVRKIKAYTMGPGDAQLYPQGAIHSPIRRLPGKLVRVEGQDLDTVEQDSFTPE
ncbi:hypothetical protein [Sansalvadorimonas verongulae]|uniref:hypothetical protein n=1 Tax=Sansalvadorimonas verongulae TaxID=2172824 RepID=UPI0012BC5B56|nr:hypothetical protein [Sansalvadorimonas verongulae]MTI12871.1 hypothetical protein [Sansalvadorimonas verongulae]